MSAFMKKRIIISIICFLISFAFLYGYSIREEFSVYRPSYPEFKICEETDLFYASVDNDGFLTVIPCTSFCGDVISIPDNTSIQLIPNDKMIVDISSSFLEKKGEGTSGEETISLSYDEIIVFLRNYSENELIEAEFSTITKENSSVIYNVILLSGEYSGELVMYANHGDHTCTVPIVLTNISDIVKPDLIDLSAIPVAAWISLFAAVTGFLVTSSVHEKANRKKYLIIGAIVFGVLFILQAVLVILYG